jgi:hypothetical protein
MIAVYEKQQKIAAQPHARTPHATPAESISRTTTHLIDRTAVQPHAQSHSPSFIVSGLACVGIIATQLMWSQISEVTQINSRPHAIKLNPRGPRRRRLAQRAVGDFRH